MPRREMWGYLRVRDAFTAVYRGDNALAPRSFVTPLLMIPLICA